MTDMNEAVKPRL